MLFMDFRQVFGSVQRIKLYKAMQDMKILLKLKRLTKMAMRYTKPKIKYENMVNKLFIFNKGVKQGDGVTTTRCV